ncbi:MAG: hypothetical protein A2406_04345 [Candidatus Komeilibacteria bacterium RIFOXYC1_FULL_37_11]|uniref:Methyltransferase domain-containing protein n=1 Tax=Candidatus Komeilibacteria bacterium RIFOXYC1_FULL_37_11 TaxID=1798555 RepID=A0A1G2C248_9BACT|nr:MAG: hypothetical protein A2406_04345 [Candidatus Komeilibacteria bacterium RIFOXYC1_FULL_37_11]OGY95426.1 MAG: hypothetical protein A2611_01870 [Candidatus Komeilibacteria bacterium RIFOXYD1_FULL_37_29]OGY96842.1 MAG: hypothetical protein A2543_00420 [Candidatus Komeilibacteria bacterium RIFOXYD2_FULL_37_8]
MIPESFKSIDEYIMYIRHVFAYNFCSQRIPPKAAVLDVGCGEGYGTHIISSVSDSAIGLDVEQEVIIRAAKKYGSNNCVFQIYNGTDIPFATETFDIVISLQVIEHIKNAQKYLEEISRVLKKNGICIFTTPNKKMRLKSQQKPWNHFHVREYNGLELRQTLEQIFSKIEIYGIYGSPSIQKIETQRIAKIQKLLRLDPLGIRLLLPESWKQKLVLLMRLITQKHTPEKIDYTKSLNVDDFYISPNTDESLDILAVCTKKS